jgi:acyl carrier protein
MRASFPLRALGKPAQRPYHPRACSISSGRESEPAARRRPDRPSARLAALAAARTGRYLGDNHNNRFGKDLNHQEERLVPELAEIETKVKKIVAEQMGVAEDEIRRETSFVNDLNADSLDTVELVMEFEEKFELNIPDEEAEKIQTVGQAIDYIKQHLDNAK